MIRTTAADGLISGDVQEHASPDPRSAKAGPDSAIGSDHHNRPHPPIRNRQLRYVTLACQEAAVCTPTAGSRTNPVLSNCTSMPRRPSEWREVPPARRLRVFFGQGGLPSSQSVQSSLRPSCAFNSPLGRSPLDLDQVLLAGRSARDVSRPHEPGSRHPRSDPGDEADIATMIMISFPFSCSCACGYAGERPYSSALGRKSEIQDHRLSLAAAVTRLACASTLWMHERRTDRQDTSVSRRGMPFWMPAVSPA